MRNRCCYWAFLPASSAGDYPALGKLAEGEELGSNLLRVTQSSLGDPGGLGRFFGKGPPPEVACSSLKGARPIPGLDGCTGPKTLFAVAAQFRAPFAGSQAGFVGGARYVTTGRIWPA
jgi:hypothetical protein